ncbi:MAG: hypothetical protein Q7T74_07155 [Candidatus Saccharibacteria bacterium]|nr:hypothetical protein [Candidatus Saccharibacteria bacterium]
MTLRNHQAIPLTKDFLALLMILVGVLKITTAMNYLMSSVKDEDTNWIFVRKQFFSTYSTYATRCNLPLTHEAFETLKRVIQQYPNIDFELLSLDPDDEWLFEVGVGIFSCSKVA